MNFVSFHVFLFSFLRFFFFLKKKVLYIRAGLKGNARGGRLRHWPTKVFEFVKLIEVRDKGPVRATVAGELFLSARSSFFLIFLKIKIFAGKSNVFFGWR